MASPGNQHCANCIGTLLFLSGARIRNKQKTGKNKLEVVCTFHTV